MYYLLLTVSFPSFFILWIIIALKKKKLLCLWFFLAVGETQSSSSFFFFSFFSPSASLPLPLFVVDWVVFPRLWRSRDTAGLITCMCIRREVLGANSQLTPARTIFPVFFFKYISLFFVFLVILFYFVLFFFPPPPPFFFSLLLSTRTAAVVVVVFSLVGPLIASAPGRWEKSLEQKSISSLSFSPFFGLLDKY